MKIALFECLECGKKFYSTKAAEKAANDGCPKCGGVDIDVPRTNPRRGLAGANAEVVEDFKPIA